MELLVKVGDKRYPTNSNYLQGWRDGQIIDVRPDGFHKNPAMLKRMCLIRVPGDYWALRGTTEWKSDKQSVMDFKKFLVPTDSNGKYPWEFGYLKDEKRIRCRDWFIDYQDLLDKGHITKANYDSLYDFNGISNLLTIDRDFTALLNHEDAKTRIKPFIKNMAVSTGIFTIGAAGDYATVTAAEADIDTALTGDLTFEHLDEETTISTAVVFDTDTVTFLLKLTAASGAEHDGTAYGNGARVDMTAGDSIVLDETIADDLDNVEMSKLALNAAGTNNKGIFAFDVGGTVLINRMLIAGDTDSLIGIELQTIGTACTVRNNIVYGFGNGAGDAGIKINIPTAAGKTVLIANNTVIKCYDNIVQNRTGSVSYDLTVKNTLCQEDVGGADYRDDGAGFGTTAKNYAEDVTSPDSLQENFHDGTSNFVDYVGNNYLMALGGDAIATLKAGEDLTGLFTDDIIGNTRTASAFFIGASWIDTGVVAGPPAGSLALMGVGI